MARRDFQKLSLFVGFAVAASIVAAIFFLFTPFFDEQDISIHQAEKLVSALDPDLREGDLVFRRGRGFWSETFSDRAGSNLSHVGVVVREGDDWVVIHAEADDLTLIGGVQSTPLSIFISRTVLRHVRRIQMTDDSRAVFVKNLREHLRRQTPFDTSLSLDDDAQRVYCSELIWSAAQRAGVELARPRELLGKSYITIDDLFFSPLLSVVEIPPRS